MNTKRNIQLMVTGVFLAAALLIGTMGYTANRSVADLHSQGQEIAYCYGFGQWWNPGQFLMWGQSMIQCGADGYWDFV